MLNGKKIKLMRNHRLLMTDEESRAQNSLADCHSSIWRDVVVSHVDKDLFIATIWITCRQQFFIELKHLHRI